jgi:hypothetical protein
LVFSEKAFCDEVCEGTKSFDAFASVNPFGRLKACAALAMELDFEVSVLFGAVF